MNCKKLFHKGKFVGVKNEDFFANIKGLTVQTFYQIKKPA